MKETGFRASTNMSIEPTEQKLIWNPTSKSDIGLIVRMNNAEANNEFATLFLRCPIKAIERNIDIITALDTDGENPVIKA